MPRLIPTALALLLPLAACDGDAPMEANTFTLRVDDGEVQTRTDAYFGTYLSDDAGTTFALVLGTEPEAEADSLSQPVVGFVRVGGDRGPGRYTLSSLDAPTDDGFSFGFYVDSAQFEADGPDRPALAGFYFATSGTLTLEEIDDERAVGSFEMTAAGFGDDFEPDERNEVRLTGEFHAVVSVDFGGEGSLLVRRAFPIRLPLSF